MNGSKSFSNSSYTPADDVKGYSIHGATVSEVELDVLTGEKLVKLYATWITFLNEALLFQIHLNVSTLSKEVRNTRPVNY